MQIVDGLLNGVNSVEGCVLYTAIGFSSGRHANSWCIFGDCNGFNRDTRTVNDDYSIIKHFFENNGFRVDQADKNG